MEMPNVSEPMEMSKQVEQYRPREKQHEQLEQYKQQLLWQLEQCRQQQQLEQRFHYDFWQQIGY